MAYQRSLSNQHQLELYQAITKYAPGRVKSTYSAQDLINDVFLEYLQRKNYPEAYVASEFEIDLELVRKLIYHRKFANDRPKYPTHRTSQFDATELELIARERLVIEEYDHTDSNLISWLREMFTSEIESRSSSVFDKFFEPLGNINSQ
jgi:hypothetical protein